MEKLKKLNLISFYIISFLILSLTISIPTTISFNGENHLKVPSVLTLTPHDPIEILKDDNFTDYGFPGSGTSSAPYIIENYEIITTNERGISINDTTKYFVIRNCYLDAADYGIYVDDVAVGTASIEENICINNLQSGIYLFYCDETILLKNNCTDNLYGISLLYSDDSALKNNTCSNNNHGVYLTFSKNLTIMYNYLLDNNHKGIYLAASDDCKVVHNICSNNDIGISINVVPYGEERHTVTTDDCILSYNLLTENENYGVDVLTRCEGNIIHHNSFIGNNLEGTSQANDNGTETVWFEVATEEGNYWNEWDSKDPYPIDGPANSTDPYPLNEYLERINYGFVICIPLLGILAIISRNMRKRNRKSI